MRLISEANHLRAHTTHLLPARLRAWVQTARFNVDIQRIAADQHAIARLMIKLLEEVALNPRQGRHDEDFFQVDGTCMAFFLTFDRVVNPISTFLTVDRNDPVTVQLIEAVTANLSGRMFKAAVIHRNLDKRAVRVRRRIEEKASAARHAVYQSILSDPGRTQRTPFTDEEKALISAASDAASKPLEAKLQRRVQAIAALSAPELSGRSYSHWFADFLFRSMPFALRQQATGTPGG